VKISGLHLFFASQPTFEFEIPLNYATSNRLCVTPSGPAGHKFVWGDIKTIEWSVIHIVMDKHQLQTFWNGVVGILISVLILKISQDVNWDSFNWQMLSALPVALYLGPFTAVAFFAYCLW
jgi:hypothetical protein